MREHNVVEYKRRCKIIWIEDQYMMSLFNFWGRYINLDSEDSDEIQCVAVPIVMGLPKDYVVLNVFYEPSRMCFGILIYHPTFPLIPEGVEFPTIHNGIKIVEIPAKNMLQKIKIK